MNPATSNRLSPQCILVLGGTGKTGWFNQNFSEGEFLDMIWPVPSRCQPATSRSRSWTRTTSPTSQSPR